VLVLAIGLFVLRAVVGVTVSAHGAQKLFGWFEGPGLSGFGGMLASLKVRPAKLWALVAAGGEFGGGVLLVLGLLNPIAGFMVAGSMLVAILLVHRPHGFWNSKRGYEFPLQILAAAVALTLTGFGPFSVDAALRIALPEPVTWIVVALLTLASAAAVAALPRLAERGAVRRTQLG
jgi:putative oxidoreductase